MDIGSHFLHIDFEYKGQYDKQVCFTVNVDGQNMSIYRYLTMQGQEYIPLSKGFAYAEQGEPRLPVTNTENIGYFNHSLILFEDNEDRKNILVSEYQAKAILEYVINECQNIQEAINFLEPAILSSFGIKHQESSKPEDLKNYLRQTITLTKSENLSTFLKKFLDNHLDFKEVKIQLDELNAKFNYSAYQKPQKLEEMYYETGRISCYQTALGKLAYQLSIIENDQMLDSEKDSTYQTHLKTTKDLFYEISNMQNEELWQKRINLANERETLKIAFDKIESQKKEIQSQKEELEELRQKVKELQAKDQEIDQLKEVNKKLQEQLQNN